MDTHADKIQEEKSPSVSNEQSHNQVTGASTFQFVDNRPEAISQRKLQEAADNSSQVSQLRAYQEMGNNNSEIQQIALFQSNADNYTAQQQHPIQRKENNTGLPDKLKMGAENLSGISLDDVKVHRNSDKPAQLQAHAYAQGTDIHLASGQEKHLPHEAWHVVQQKQGRVKPTMQLKGKVNINTDRALENEADIMGSRAMRSFSIEERLPSNTESAQLIDVSKSESYNNQVRQFTCGSSSPPAIDDVIKDGKKSKPSDIADQIGEESENFKALRGKADEEVGKTYGEEKKVGYNNKPKKGGGSGTAYYKDGDTFYDAGAPIQQTVLNIVFETANAAQAGLFKKVEVDYDDGSLMDNPLTDYIEDPSALGSLVDDFTDLASKRSLIQEYYEWNSFKIAESSLLDIAPKYIEGGVIPSLTWETSFGEILECTNFEEYYGIKGKGHRGAVEATLKPKAASEEGGDKINLDGLFK